MKAQEIKITMTDGTPLYTKKDACELLGVSEDTINRWLKLETIIATPNNFNRALFTKDNIRKTALLTGRAAYFLERITV